MKINRHHLQGVAIGLALIATVPLVAFAARTAVPLVSSLFPNSSIYVNMTNPVVSLPTAPATGSLTVGTVYFAVTALDGQGESINGNLVGTTTTASGALQLTWPAVPGAFGYRVYFSTSTPLTLTQYFAATSTNLVPNNYYTFTSTSSPTFIAGGQPANNTAFGAIINGVGNSFLLGGAVAIGTSTFPANVQFQVGTSTATSTALIGAKGASGGRLIMVDSNGTHSTCSEITTNAGTVSGKVVTCP